MIRSLSADFAAAASGGRETSLAAGSDRRRSRVDHWRCWSPG